MNFEEIMARKLERVPADLDKREGSIIHTALGPDSLMDAEIYAEMDMRVDEAFADTASREYLIRRCAEQGITPYKSTKAVVSTTGLIAGSRYQLENTDIEYRADASTKATAIKFGSNIISSGRLIPVNTADPIGLITGILTVGEDDEPTEDLRKRYFDVFKFKRSFGGNITSFEDVTNDIPGVGATKVFRAWQGPGTVRLCILDGDLKPASQTLIDTVQAIIDPTINSPLDVGGHGVAPIGAKTTVMAGKEVDITVTGTWTGDVEDAINEYFTDLKRTWYNTRIEVKINRVLMAMLGVVDDVDNLKLNGQTNNIILEVDEIPKLVI